MEFIGAPKNEATLAKTGENASEQLTSIVSRKIAKLSSMFFHSAATVLRRMEILQQKVTGDWLSNCRQLGLFRSQRVLGGPTVAEAAIR
jgi:hypothetical protein